MKERVAVIGGSGFLGSHLADALSDAGYSVSIFDITPSPWIRSDQEMIVGNILNEDALADCLDGAHYVYHLAGIADLEKAAAQPKATVKHNIMGSMAVLEACLKARIKRFLFASTIYVYSQKGSFYRASKQAVELLIEAYHERFGIEYTILRYGSLYGPRAQEWNGFKRFVTQAVKKRKIVYFGTGEERREYIHVKDAARLSVEALSPSYENKCLTLTGTQAFTSKELLETIKEILGGDIELTFKPGDHDSQYYHYTLTPYRFTPRGGHKIVPNLFIDIGQGILDIVEEIHRKNNKEES